jgi:hypothetical protein
MNHYLINTDDMNAPSFAFYARTRKKKFISGRGANHPGRIIQGVMIDNLIPTKEMIKLFKCKQIMMRSSCEGTDEYGPFFIFRIPGYNKTLVNRICSLMNMVGKHQNIICKFGTGSEGEFRVIVTANFTKDEVTDFEYKKWWINAVDNLLIILKKQEMNQK